MGFPMGMGIAIWLIMGMQMGNNAAGMRIAYFNV